jgi:hypothetical protein
VRLCVCIYVCMYVCMCVCMCVCMYVCMYVCVCMYICIYVCIYVCMHGRIYVSADIHTYLHTQTHTHSAMWAMSDLPWLLVRRGWLRGERDFWDEAGTDTASGDTITRLDYHTKMTRDKSATQESFGLHSPWCLPLPHPPTSFLPCFPHPESPPAFGAP